MTLTQAQLDLRLTGITGTETGALNGVHPFMTPIDVYLAKTEKDAPRFNPGWRAHVGNVMEPHLMQFYAERTGRVVQQPGTLRHPKDPLVIATPDGVTSRPGEPDMVLEAKCPGWRGAGAFGEPGTDQIPDHYLAQVTWEMAVTGLEFCHLVVDLGRFEPDIFAIEFNRDVYDAMVEVAHTFWHKHVVPRIPPPADGTETYGNYLRQQLKNVNKGVMKPSNPQIQQIAEELHGLRMQKDEIEQHIEQRNQALQLYIAQDDGIDFGMDAKPYRRITWRQPKAGRKVDYDGILRAAAVPDDVVQAHTTWREASRRMHLSEHPDLKRNK